MAAAAPLISVPKNLCKHFAVLTLVITACVAIFADGESRQALTEQIEHRQAAVEQRVQAARAADQQRAANLGGLLDNRGNAVSANDDVGEAPQVEPTALLLSGEVREADLAAAVARPAQRKSVRRLPPVLPPGLPASPILQPGSPPAIGATPSF